MRKYHLKKCSILSLFVYLISIQLYSQEDVNRFDIIYYQLANEFSPIEPNLVLSRVDSLYENSSNSEHKVRTLMLKALLYNRSSDKNNALKYAEDAELLALQTKNYDWRVRALGFIASQYQSLGLFKESNSYIDKAEEELKSIQNVDSHNMYLSNLLESKSINAFGLKDYDKTLEYLKQSDSLKDIIPNLGNSEYFKTTSEALKGSVYFQLKRYDLSELAFLNCKKFLDTIGDKTDPLYGVVYTGFGNLAFVKGMDSSVVWGYYEKAIKLIDTSSDFDVSVFLYENLLVFFAAQKDWEQYYIYNKKLTEQYNITDRTKNEVVVKALDRLHHSESDARRLKVFIYSMSTIFICILLGLIFYNRKKKQKSRLKYKSTIESLEEKLTASVNVDEINKVLKNKDFNGSIEDGDCENDGGNTVPKSKIPKETEARILARILKFEQEKLYLIPNVSLIYLATYCETNSKYISSILKQFKEKDYSSYVNELRIYYIIQKLKEEKPYRTYKISYLAELTGFSSHSVFSTVFKNIMGVSPSEFIGFLNEGSENDSIDT